MEQGAAYEFQIALMEALKAARKSRGLSHERLSELSGISRQAISKIESGQRNPTMLTVYRLVSAMDMTLAEFVNEIG